MASSPDLKPVPNIKDIMLACGEEYDISVSNTIQVEDCDNISAVERTKMFNELNRKWFVEALSQCGALSDCANPEVVDFEATPGSCEREGDARYWTQTAIFKTKCTP
tara:strand:+ start:1131 stop:1451 length:321 start_codon:yes stop_codon:yes gene_type:complete